jgi:hypothetical protein
MLKLAMLSEVRRQPNEVEAPRACRRRPRPWGIFTAVSVQQEQKPVQVRSMGIS